MTDPVWGVTDKGEAHRRNEVDIFAVHDEGDSKVDGQGAPDEKLVDDCPVVCIQAQLQNTR